MLERLRNLPIPTWHTPAVFIRLRSTAQPYAEQAAQRLAPYWERAHGWYEKRAPREKVLLQVVGALLALLLIYNLLYLPLVNLRGDLADKVDSRKRALVEVRAMMRTHDRLRAELAQTEKRTVPGRDFSLFSVVEQALTKSVGRDKIGSITPADHSVPGGLTQYTVSVQLSGISLAQVVDALYGVQTLSLPVSISSLQIREHAQNSRSYDIEMTCMALGKQG